MAVEAARIALEAEVARHQALVDGWDRKRAAGGRAGKKPVPVQASRRVARQRERLARAEAAAGGRTSSPAPLTGSPGRERQGERRNLSRSATSPTRTRH